MADLHTHSVQEAVNATVGGGWTVSSAGTAGSSANVNASNDLLIPANTQFFITIPRGLGNTIYFNFNSTSTTTGAVRMVEI